MARKTSIPEFTKNSFLIIYTEIGQWLKSSMNKNIIAFGPEKLGMDYHIHSADEFILVSEMEEAVLIYMEAIKNLLAI